MKKMIVMFLAFLIVLTSSPQQQGMDLIIKSVAFVHHFIHHVQCQDENIGLGAFVYLHYFDHDHDEKDHDEHEDLPFSHHQKNTVSIPIVFFYTPIEEWMFFNKVEFIIKQNFCYQAFIPSHFNSNIWKPPRFEV